MYKVYNKLEESMNTVRKIENMMIYIRFIKMKLMLCGINNRLGTAEKNTKFEDIRTNYPKSNTRGKKTKKLYRV